MLSKLLGGAGDYDLVQPSEYVVESLVKADKLAEIDFANVPNIKNINEK
jgi:spermidine/putrescine transport system substrate-binding protein